MSNHKRSRKELDALPIPWEEHEHENCDKWAVLEAPDGRELIYYMSARSYRLEGERETKDGAPELMYKRLFTDKDPVGVPFGRYEGHSAEWIVATDRSYAQWLLGVAKKDWIRRGLRAHL